MPSCFLQSQRRLLAFLLSLRSTLWTTLTSYEITTTSLCTSTKLHQGKIDNLHKTLLLTPRNVPGQIISSYKLRRVWLDLSCDHLKVFDYGWIVITAVIYFISIYFSTPWKATDVDSFSFLPINPERRGEGEIPLWNSVLLKIFYWFSVIEMIQVIVCHFIKLFCLFKSRKVIAHCSHLFYCFFFFT